MAIVDANSCGMGYDADHALTPHHETILKHGYAYSHSVPVVRLGNERINHHCYKHTVVRGVEALLVGVWYRNGSWQFNAHKSGSGASVTRLASDLDRFLKQHVARAVRKCQTAGNCPICGRVATHDGYCSPYCKELAA